MPINRKYNLNLLLGTLREELRLRPKSIVLFEYVMLAGVNDRSAISINFCLVLSCSVFIKDLACSLIFTLDMIALLLTYSIKIVFLLLFRKIHYSKWTGKMTIYRAWTIVSVVVVTSLL